MVLPSDQTAPGTLMAVGDDLVEGALDPVAITVVQVQRAAEA